MCRCLLSPKLCSSIFFPSPNRMSGTIPTESSKASTADDMEITNYNELVEFVESSSIPSLHIHNYLYFTYTCNIYSLLYFFCRRKIGASGKKIEKCHTGTGIPRPTLDTGGLGLGLVVRAKCNCES
ncbi:hypothetical protein M9H77_36474 [Catharanthus roseus]|uniref:Uncharacterized protein n=1 Tax=Catharanthus roseus TaxID=4058 RepID=A0ACB9ZSY0_CATRO|nr:hypothetical protein M9H77_36474 [Catharanthus roseus]